MRFATLSIAALMALLPLMKASDSSIVPAENQICSEYNEEDDNVKYNWWGVYYLTQHKEIDTIWADEIVSLNGINWHFKAQSGPVDFVSLSNGNSKKGQFKISFMRYDMKVLESVWATESTFCRLPRKLNRSEVAKITIHMRKF
jgi:hypothetical protein